MLFFYVAYPYVLFLALVCVVFGGWYRWYWYRAVECVYALTDFLYERGIAQSLWRDRVLFAMRTGILCVLALLASRPQIADPDKQVHIQGIDIMLVLDVSSSMQLFDDLSDRRPRIQVAKEEAINFVRKREHDQIGLVIFGGEVASRCPLTLDHALLTESIAELAIGTIASEETRLCAAALAGINRLRDARAASKVMIVLTDGDAHDAGGADQVIAIAQKLGIKIYTIGIGGNGQAYAQSIFGVQRVVAQLNTQLLETIAHKTGGRFFMVRNPSDMAAIYTTIDQLERTEYPVDAYRHGYDWFLPLVWLVVCLIMIELVLTAWVWNCF